MSPVKILVIDDEEHILLMLKNRLKANGFDVLTASSGHKGLELAQQNIPDIILLDVMLPDLNGRVVCRVLKEDKSTANIPVIFLTAKNSKEERMAEYDVGGECHIPKPFEAKDLIEKINRTLENFKAYDKERRPSDGNEDPSG